MEILVSLLIGVLTACGVYLALRGRSFPVLLGLTLLSYAVNLFLFVVGRLSIGAPPIIQTNRAVCRPIAPGVGIDRYRDQLRHDRLRRDAGAARTGRTGQRPG